MNRALLALCLTALLAACSDVTPPERAETYPFTIDCSIEGLCSDEAGDLQFVFRWPRESLPLRIWMARGGRLGQPVASAIVLWERVALYGEFRATFVRDSADADVIVRQGSPVTIAGATGNGNGSPIDCTGSTTIEVVDAGSGDAQLPTIQLPFITTISPRSGQGGDDVDKCFARVAAHELGHVLGLFLDSPDNPDDLMYVRPTRDQASARDRATFARLYHTAPTVSLPAGR